MLTVLIIYLIINVFVAGASFKNMDGYTLYHKFTLTILFLLIGLIVFIWFKFLEKYWIRFQCQFFIDLYLTKKWSRRLHSIELERLRVLYRKYSSQSTEDRIFRFCAEKVFDRNKVEI